jgi:hypothetical protein
MRPLREKKASSLHQREEQLRQGRAAAQALRDACPTAAVVNVTLRFQTQTLPLHAEQSFTLYPAARAYFAYPCPYGDCDGVFDLSAAANRTLTREKTRVTGTLECGGLRARDGLPRQPCGLRVSYTITASHEQTDE